MSVVSTPTITLDPSGNAPLAALVEFETTELAKVSLEVTDGSETQTIHFDDYATVHEVPLFGLKPDTAYTVKANYTGADGATEIAATRLGGDHRTASGRLPNRKHPGQQAGVDGTGVHDGEPGR